MYHPIDKNKSAIPLHNVNRIITITWIKDNEAADTLARDSRQINFKKIHTTNFLFKNYKTDNKNTYTERDD